MYFLKTILYNRKCGYTIIYQQTLVKKYIIIDSMKVLLDQIMYERNLTVRQVSIMTGVPKSTISDIVSGRTSPRLNTLEQLAARLKVRMTDLFESTYK